jgi:hypothetical protein
LRQLSAAEDAALPLDMRLARGMRPDERDDFQQRADELLAKYPNDAGI